MLARFFVFTLILCYFPHLLAFTGQELLQSCSTFLEINKKGSTDISNEDAFEVGRCAGFVDGLIDGHMFIAVMKNGEAIKSGKMKLKDALIFCESGKNTKLDIIELLVKDLKSFSKEQLTNSAAMVSLIALSKEFSCH